MIRWASMAALAALFVVAAAPAAAQDWDFGVRGGYYTDVEEGFLGIEALVPLDTDGTVFFINPNLEWVFVDPGELWSLNLDGHWDFWNGPTASAWLGAGLAAIFREIEVGRRGRSEDETDIGVNLLAGLGARRGELRPYVQGKAVLSDETEFVIAVGLRFF